MPQSDDSETEDHLSRVPTDSMLRSSSLEARSGTGGMMPCLSPKISYKLYWAKQRHQCFPRSRGVEGMPSSLRHERTIKHYHVIYACKMSMYRISSTSYVHTTENYHFLGSEKRKRSVTVNYIQDSCRETDSRARDRKAFPAVKLLSSQVNSVGKWPDDSHMTLASKDFATLILGDNAIAQESGHAGSIAVNNHSRLVSRWEKR